MWGGFLLGPALFHRSARPSQCHLTHTVWRTGTWRRGSRTPRTCSPSRSSGSSRPLGRLMRLGRACLFPREELSAWGCEGADPRVALGRMDLNSRPRTWVSLHSRCLSPFGVSSFQRSGLSLVEFIRKELVLADAIADGVFFIFFLGCSWVAPRSTTYFCVLTLGPHTLLNSCGVSNSFVAGQGAAGLGAGQRGPKARGPGLGLPRTSSPVSRSRPFSPPRILGPSVVYSELSFNYSAASGRPLSKHKRGCVFV